MKDEEIISEKEENRIYNTLFGHSEETLEVIKTVKLTANERIEAIKKELDGKIANLEASLKQKERLINELKQAESKCPIHGGGKIAELERKAMQIGYEKCQMELSEKINNKSAAKYIQDEVRKISGVGLPLSACKVIAYKLEKKYEVE